MHHHIDLARLPALLSSEANRLRHDLPGIDIFPASIVIGKQGADVITTGGAENRIGDGVKNGIPIGMSDGADPGRNRDTGKDQLVPRFESMSIGSDADPDRSVLR